MGKNQLFHVVWTTFNEYPVWDKHGDWQRLANTYAALQKHDISCTLSHELQLEYLNNNAKKDRILLPEKAVTHLENDINELCLQNKDRIINGLKIEMLHVTQSKVEILVFSNINLIAQKVGRLKSRTSTLLSFKYPGEFFGKGTWAKGFWYSQILNKEDLAVSIIKNNH